MKKIVLLFPFVLILHLNLLALTGFPASMMDTTVIVETLCTGECLEINDTEFCVGGIYLLEVDNGNDTAYYDIDLTILDPIVNNLQETLCEFECYQLGANQYCQSGTYTEVFTSYLGCDSTVILDLTILDNSTPQITIGNTGPLDCVNTSVFLLASSPTPGVTYFWEGPGIDANNQNQQSPEVDLSGIYTVTVTTPEGCSAQASTEVLGSAAPPEIEISGNDPLNCNNYENVIVASSNTHQNIEYEWIDGGVVVSNGPEITVNETGQLTLAIATPSGCLDTITVNVTENDDPLFVDGGPNRHIQCEFILQLNAPGAAGTNVVYQWTTTNGNILSGANTLTPVINKAGTYTLTATDLDNGCTGSDDVIVYNALAIIPENVLTFDCTTSQLTIDATESYMGQDAFIQWTTTTGNIVEGANSLLLTVDAPGVYQLVIIRLGCVSFATAIVLDETDPPSVTVQSSGNLLTCQDPNIDINAITDDPTATFFWTFNGNPFSVDQSISVGNPGTYQVVVTGANACTNSESITIEADTEPNDIFIFGDTELDCDNNGIGILEGFATGDDNGSYQYNWFTISGEILSPPYLNAITIAGEGVYCLEVINPINGCTNLACADVFSVSSIDADLVATDVSCPGSNDGSIEIINVTGGTPPYSYTWTTGQVDTPVISGLSPGSYAVTISDIQGCYTILTAEIGVSSTSPIIANAGDDEFFDCLTSFLVLNGGNSEYPQDAIIEWTTIDGEILANGNTPFPTVGSPGTYTLTITDPVGCSDSDEVVVFETTANAGPDRFINCNFPETNLDGTQSQGDGTYLWTTLNGNIVSGETTLTPIVNAIGTYTLTVTSPNGCTSASSTVVTGDFAEPQLTAGDQSMTSCVDPVLLDAEADLPGTVFSWTGPNGPLAGENPEVFDPGIYTVLGTAANGCTNTATMEVIDLRTYPEASKEQVQYLNCFNGIPYTIEITFDSQNGVEAFWYTNNGNIVSQQNEIVMVDAPGTYEVHFYDIITNCENVDSVIIEEDGVVINTTQTTTSCGENDGTAGVSTSGINHPVFNWSNGATTASVDGVAPGFYTITISSATGSCTEERSFEILQDPSCLVLVSGTVYDDDNNFACDPEGDVSAAEEVLVHIMPVDEYTTTDENGYYEFLVPAGQYTVEVLPVSPWVVNCPASETIQLDLPPGIAEAPGNDFFLEALSGFDLYGYGSSGVANAGSNQFYQLTYCNNAFQTIHGTVEFTHDPLLTGFDAEAAGASSYDSLTYTAIWDFDDLSFFECEYLSFTLTIPDDIPDGYIIHSLMKVNPTMGDISPANNSYSWNKTARNPSNTAVETETPELAVNFQLDRNGLFQNRPNPFKEETIIPFYLHSDDAQLLIFDANGRLVRQFQHFGKGYHQVSVPSSELKGNGVYYYRLVTDDESLVGKMILLE